MTLITRPRRFGKTLTMSMVERFFSVKYADGGEVFEGLDIWKEQEYRKLQGTYPVISLSFANIKEKDCETTRRKMNEVLVELYEKNRFLRDSGLLVELSGRYVITSNRESGYGRYDIMLEPKNNGDAAIIIEFKVYDETEEHALEDTVQSALMQIEEKKYSQFLIDKGISKECIYKYGFAFRGKHVLIG